MSPPGSEGPMGDVVDLASFSDLVGPLERTDDDIHRLITALRQPASPDELAGEAATVAAMQAILASPDRFAPDDGGAEWRGLGRRRLVRRAVAAKGAAVVGAVVFGVTAAAASTGIVDLDRLPGWPDKPPAEAPAPTAPPGTSGGTGGSDGGDSSVRNTADEPTGTGETNRHGAPVATGTDEDAPADEAGDPAGNPGQHNGTAPGGPDSATPATSATVTTAPTTTTTVLDDQDEDGNGNGNGHGKGNPPPHARVGPPGGRGKPCDALTAAAGATADAPLVDTATCPHADTSF
jgi:hypothetical protein